MYNASSGLGFASEQSSALVHFGCGGFEWRGELAAQNGSYYVRMGKGLKVLYYPNGKGRIPDLGHPIPYTTCQTHSTEGRVSEGFRSSLELD